MHGQNRSDWKCFCYSRWQKQLLTSNWNGALGTKDGSLPVVSLYDIGGINHALSIQSFGEMLYDDHSAAHPLLYYK
jgi:hypothetical protein